MPSDPFLATYVETRDETAFRCLAERYSGMVYGSALRRTNSPQAAEEIVQDVFVALARKAKQLREHPCLSGWLHRATMNESANFLRREAKRQEKMRAFQAHEQDLHTEEDPMESLPQLDEALNKLPDSDRHLVLLRFFEKKSYRDIAEALGKSEVASRKQGERALTKLGDLLRARGVTASGAILTTLLTAQLSTSPPAGIVSIAAQGFASASSGSALSVMSGYVGKVVLSIATIVLLTGGFFLWKKEPSSPLQSAFEQEQLTVVIQELGADERHIYNSDRAETQFIALSTFKIPNTLILLDTGSVPNKDFPLSYDPVKYPGNAGRGAWGQDHTLESAFRKSVVWYYQECSKKLGLEAYQTHLNEFDYGDQDVSSGVDRFWLDTLEISAEEQVDFLQKFYRGELGLRKSSTETTKAFMLLEETVDYRLYGKTGTTWDDSNHFLGWLVGFVEAKGSVWFYAVNLEDTAKSYKAFNQARMSIIKKAFAALGISLQ